MLYLHAFFLFCRRENPRSATSARPVSAKYHRKCDSTRQHTGKELVGQNSPRSVSDKSQAIRVRCDARLKHCRSFQSATEQRSPSWREP